MNSNTKKGGKSKDKQEGRRNGQQSGPMKNESEVKNIQPQSAGVSNSVAKEPALQQPPIQSTKTSGQSQPCPTGRGLEVSFETITGVLEEALDSKEEVKIMMLKKGHLSALASVFAFVHCNITLNFSTLSGEKEPRLRLMTRAEANTSGVKCTDMKEPSQERLEQLKQRGITLSAVESYIDRLTPYQASAS
ncbi:uncharacterized protein PAC_20198 [Phialocephala subalpina]|uniref:Uncharacterized protein n=1 Tax=Phialocephala subalpina TaxID=576137 RepID=A0A1L7XZ62_9HELO|nr:uncharacterized protein PAC_20198 [Phialocephala subalpina]